MTANGFLQVGIYVVVLLALAKPLGAFMARVYDGKTTFLDPVMRPLERLVYRLSGIDPEEGMTWKTYAVAMLLFNALGMLAVYALQRLQGLLPLNPQGFAGGDAGLVLQHRRQLRDQHQLAGLRRRVDHELPDPDAGAQRAELRLRGRRHGDAGGVHPRLPQRRHERDRQLLGRSHPQRRSTSCCRSPSCLALLQVSQGVVQNFSAYKTVPLLQATSVTTPVKDADGNPVLDEKGEAKTETTAVTEQTLPMGPASSQIAIKQLGTNGGGFFNVNSAHPYENPTPLSNFVEMLAILLIAAALCYTFGQMVGDTRQGWAVLAAMTVHLRRHARPLRVGGVPRQPAPRRPRRRRRRERPAARRQHGGQGGALRHRQLRPLGDRHHGRVQRLGERDARLVHAARRPGADVHDAARRGGLRRRRLRASTAC